MDGKDNTEEGETTVVDTKAQVVNKVARRQTLSGEVLYTTQDEQGNPVLLKKPEHEDGDRMTRITRTDGLQGGVAACQGDSGGPLWVVWGSRNVQVGLLTWYTVPPVQVGVVSRGSGCGLLDTPGVYAWLVPAREWVVEKTQEYGCYTA